MRLMLPRHEVSVSAPPIGSRYELLHGNDVLRNIGPAVAGIAPKIEFLRSQRLDGKVRAPSQSIGHRFPYGGYLYLQQTGSDSFYQEHLSEHDPRHHRRPYDNLLVKGRDRP